MLRFLEIIDPILLSGSNGSPALRAFTFFETLSKNSSLTLLWIICLIFAEQFCPPFQKAELIAINSAFWNGGQNCSANMRQIIHSKVKDEFLDKVSKKVKALKAGDPLDPESNMGSMISKKRSIT